MATPQFLAEGGLDYIVYDYLAEITLSIMARARAKSPDAGYATDFVEFVLKPNLPEIARQRVKIISNAGGVNPLACARAAETAISEAGLDLKVAVVTGDDLLEQAQAFAENGIVEMFSGAPFPPPDKIASINCYLGAAPIAEALSRGADVVITGRGVDSAVTLGACLHAFDWPRDDWDKLAAGSLAGHVIECGPQATGGNFTDWRDVADSIADIGYPIAEIDESGRVEITKPGGTGGAVTIGTVGEQILYEIGDPAAYILPDVVCDFSDVRLESAGDDRVVVTGARGRPAPSQYKTCATYTDGWRAGAVFFFIGESAADKVRTFAEAALQRARKQLERFNVPDFTETSIEIIGDGSAFGGFQTNAPAHDVAVKLAVKHADQLGAGLVLREAVGLGLASPPGLTGFSGSRPKPSPVVRLFSFLIPRHQAKPVVHIGTEQIPIPSPDDKAPFNEEIVVTTPAAPSGVPDTEVPLIRLAWARSGDKGDFANIGVLPRRPEYAPWIWRALNRDILAERFAQYVTGDIERYFMPGMNAMNFVLKGALGGGGVASLRNDPQGKTFAQILLQTPIPISSELAGDAQ